MFQQLHNGICDSFRAFPRNVASNLRNRAPNPDKDHESRTPCSRIRPFPCSIAPEFDCSRIRSLRVKLFPGSIVPGIDRSRTPLFLDSDVLGLGRYRVRLFLDSAICGLCSFRIRSFPVPGISRSVRDVTIPILFGICCIAEGNLPLRSNY
jgi:hypothetical protein